MKKLMILPILCLLLVSYGCSKKDDKLVLDPTHMFLYQDTETKIVASEHVHTWDTENSFIATVNRAGIVLGNHVGQTYITAHSEHNEAVCYVEVQPRNINYKEPFQEFFTTKSHIKSLEDRTIFYETEDYITYLGGSSFVNYVEYYFENRLMELCLMGIDMEHAYDLDDFIDERYEYIGMQEDIYIFLNNRIDRANMAVGIIYGYDYILVMYQPVLYIGSLPETYSSEKDQSARFKKTFSKYRNSLHHADLKANPAYTRKVKSSAL